VVTWPSRYLVDAATIPEEPSALCFERQVQDACSVLGTIEASEIVVVGYCSGAALALEAAKRVSERRVRKLILVNGSFNLDAIHASRTQYEKDLDQLMPLAAKDRAAARLVRQQLQLAFARSRREHEFSDETRRPFQCDELLYRYSNTYCSFREMDSLEGTDRLGLEALVISGMRDLTASPQSSAVIAKSLPRAALHVEEDGDHYEFCRAGTSTLRVISEYMRA
jgi:pimeloyl-ACP methyl ester carboxylesterase